MSLPFMTAQEAASYIKNDHTVGFSGFTAAGAPKAVSMELAKIAVEKHQKGEPFKIGMLTGASTSNMLDGELARANAIKFRSPFQSNKDLRSRINSNDAPYFDYHLSQLAQDVRYGFISDIDIAIIEACDISDNGEIVLTSGVGNAPTYCRLAKKIIIELNSYHSKGLRGIHDIYEPLDPPNRREIPVYKPSDRAGVATIKVDPSKIIGVVESNYSDGIAEFTPLDETTIKIGENVSNFLARELKAGRIPSSFLPLQSGVGNIANAVVGCMGDNPDIPSFEMFTEVIQDSVVGLMKSGKCKFASGSSLTLSHNAIQQIYDDMDFFHSRLVLRPQEISNSPELIRRMGVIAINTAIEADIFGNINSTHIMGTKMMNGIGGSGDFARNSYMSIFTSPSTAKGGAISAFVPMVSHTDHSEHSVKVIVSEWGVADLRAKSPIERAHQIIDKVVHPDYKQLLWDYLKLSKSPAHTPHSLAAALEFHIEFNRSGDMRNTDFSKFA